VFCTVSFKTFFKEDFGKKVEEDGLKFSRSESLDE